MRKYKEYKKSGIEWLNEIPNHWDVKRGLGVFKVNRNNIRVSDFQNIDVFHYSIPNVQELGNGKVEAGNSLDSDKLLLKGDELLVSKLNPAKRTIILAEPNELPILASGEFVPLIAAKCDRRFAFYLYLSDITSQRICSTVQSVTNSHQRTKSDTVAKLWNAFPPIDEQIQIVKYLDYKTGLIDDFIASRKKQIDLLREQLHFKINEALTKGINENVNFKPTDIKYVPEIPEHWDIRKFKGLTTILTCGYASTPEYVEESEGVAFLSAQNCRPFRMDLSKYSFIKPELHKQLTRYKKPLRGDVLVTRVGAGIGEACIIDTDLEFSVYVSLTHIRPNKEILSEYIVYFFNTEYCYQLNHEGTVVGGGQGNLNVKNVERYRIPLPPIDEQKDIVAYLDNYRSETDELISKYQKQIELMQEYRTAIISQAVTGKIDVRDWQPKAKELQS